MFYEQNRLFLTIYLYIISLEYNMGNDKQTKELASVNRFLTFFVDEEQYGIDISKIKEIIAPIAITQVPKTPDFVKGVINLRGSIIPVVDIRLKFDMKARDMNKETAIIIYEVDRVSIGFIVDKVEDVLTFDDKHISEAPRFGSNIDTSFIDKVAEVGGDVIMLLNLKKIFEPQELLEIGKLEKEEEKEEEKEVE